MSTLPTNDRMYRAICERDASFVGVFFVGVRTTGIFCRPGCPARRPNRDNCTFFATAADALRAGFRPCRRCQPLRVGVPVPSVVERLIALVDEQPGARLTEHDLLAAGIDPSTARRQFRAHCGMTFHAWQRARRMGTAVRDLSQQPDIAAAMDTAGYSSHSGFATAFRDLFGEPPSAAGQVRVLYADQVMTPLGPMVAAADDAGLHLLEFHDRDSLPAGIGWLRAQYKAAIVPGEHPVLAQVRAELDEYFAGKRLTFATPVVIAGSPFQVRVWEALCRIPPGETWSYADLADSIGRPGAQRAVGRANGENRIPILIPCHRVIRSDGSLCGYGGGVWRKRRLLELEADYVQRNRPTALTRSTG